MMTAQDYGKSTILLQAWAAIMLQVPFLQTSKVVSNVQDGAYPSEKGNTIINKLVQKDDQSY